MAILNNINRENASKAIRAAREQVDECGKIWQTTFKEFVENYNKTIKEPREQVYKATVLSVFEELTKNGAKTFAELPEELGNLVKMDNSWLNEYVVRERRNVKAVRIDSDGNPLGDPFEIGVRTYYSYQTPKNPKDLVGAIGGEIVKQMMTDLLFAEENDD